LGLGSSGSGVLISKGLKKVSSVLGLRLSANAWGLVDKHSQKIAIAIVACSFLIKFSIWESVKVGLTKRFVGEQIDWKNPPLLSDNFIIPNLATIKFNNISIGSLIPATASGYSYFG
jgi:hypothetical protein